MNANLCGDNLVDPNLSGANLVETNLIGANLGGAILDCADLYHATLADANLRDAKLWSAIVDYVELKGTKFATAQLNGRRFVDANRAEAIGLEEVEHFVPSGSSVAMPQVESVGMAPAGLATRNPKAMKTWITRHHDLQPVFVMTPFLDGATRLRSLEIANCMAYKMAWWAPIASPDRTHKSKHAPLPWRG